MTQRLVITQLSTRRTDGYDSRICNRAHSDFFGRIHLARLQAPPMSWFRRPKKVDTISAREQYLMLIARGVRPGDASYRTGYTPIEDNDHWGSAGVCSNGVCTPSRDNQITGYSDAERHFDEVWHATHHGRQLTDAEEYARQQEWTPDMGLTRDLHQAATRQDEISVTRPERHSLPEPQPLRIEAPRLSLPDERIEWPGLTIGHWVTQSDGSEYWVDT